MGCRERAPRAALRRFATVEGRVVPDPEARLPGRGAWLHPARDCFDAAVARRGFQRAFKAPVTIPEDTVDFTRTWPRSAFTS
ncbi:MAG: YlxR family protein [Candidatus Limnocylindria bacterium]